MVCFGFEPVAAGTSELLSEQFDLDRTLCKGAIDDVTW